MQATSSMSGCCEGVVYLVGVLTVARWVVYLGLDLLAALRKFLWARLFPDNLRVKYGGSWAVVTGCTSGIGKEYARQLARRGMNVLLLSRNIDKLNSVQKLIKDESPAVETETVQVDFSQGRVVYETIAPHFKGKNIGVLVNNVGVMGSGGSSVPTKFINLSEDDIWNHVNVNVGAIVAMTRLVLPQMLTRRKGAIINISSVGSSSPMPLFSVYCGTKVFDDFFSQSLAWECKGTGVTVQTIRPGGVISNMSQTFETEPKLFVPTASDFVHSALSTLGHAERTTGYWPHGLQVFILELFNRKILMAMSEKATISFMRKKGLYKAE